MADMLKVSQQEIEQLCAKLRGKSGEATIFLQEVQKVINEANMVWVGASSDKFHSEFSRLRSELQTKLDDYLKSLADALKKVAEHLRQADEDIAKNIKLESK